jgi:hypothetical protein
MAFLSGTHGEPQEPEDACDKCREKMRLYRVAPFYCAVDGTVEDIASCFEEATWRIEDARSTD